MSHRSLVYALSAVCCAALIVSAQVRVDVRLVNIVATVTDGYGRYVGNLEAQDFIIEEDGVPQKIAHFSQDQEIPVSIGILLDTSGSMERKIRTAKDAVDRFVRTIHDDDDIFLMTFSGEPTLRQDFTNDRDKLSKALSRIRVTGGTALYDALTQGLDRIYEGRHDKRAVLVITDGEDTSSLTTFDETLRHIRESELLVYCLAISPMTYGQRRDHVPFSWPLPPALGGRRGVSSRRDAVNMDVLREFADNSGGRAYLLSDSLLAGRGAQIQKVLNQIAEELRSQYTLGYYPAVSDDGRYHSIRVRTRTGQSVRARRGYIAAAAEQ